jgi:hypothetical protein
VTSQINDSKGTPIFPGVIIAYTEYAGTRLHFYIVEALTYSGARVRNLSTGRVSRLQAMNRTIVIHPLHYTDEMYDAILKFDNDKAVGM